DPESGHGEQGHRAQGAGGALSQIPHHGSQGQAPDQAGLEHVTGNDAQEGHVRPGTGATYRSERTTRATSSPLSRSVISFRDCTISLTRRTERVECSRLSWPARTDLRSTHRYSTAPISPK